MDIAAPERRTPPESIVPMINVVFLLLIFFLMTATLSPPEPLRVMPPESSAEVPAGTGLPLFVGADGRMAWGAAEGDAAIAALAASTIGRSDAAPLVVRADRELDGAALARLLGRLAATGIVRSELIAAPPE